MNIETQNSSTSQPNSAPTAQDTTDYSSYESVINSVLMSESDEGQTEQAQENLQDQGDQNQSAEGENVSADPSLDDIAKELSGLTADAEDGEQSDKEKALSEEKAEQMFELIRDGEAHKVPLTQMKELAQKGFDYTQKTQALSEERKRFSEESELAIRDLEQAISKHSEDLKSKQLWDHYVDNLKQSDPDLYEQVRQGFSQLTGAYNNPIVNQAIESLRAENQKLKQGFEEIQHEKVRKQLDTELNQVKSEFDPVAKALNMKLEWDKVVEAWKNGAKDVKTAFYAIYGEDITKRYKSRAKVEQTKKKASPAVRTAGTLKRTQEVQEPVDVSQLSYHQIADYAARGLV